MIDKELLSGLFLAKRAPKNDGCSQWYETCRNVAEEGAAGAYAGLETGKGNTFVLFHNFLVSDNSLNGLLRAVNDVNCC